jgi:hypothetical protein
VGAEPVPVRDGDIISLLVVPEERADGSFYVADKTSRESQDAQAWGQLEFGDKSTVELSTEPDTPFVIGKDSSKCDSVVVDEWVDPRTPTRKGSRVSGAHCKITLPSASVGSTPVDLDFII